LARNKEPCRAPPFPMRGDIACFGISSIREQRQAQNVGKRALPSQRRQTVCKPGSVPPESGDGHSSGTFVAERLTRPTRAAARKARPAAPANAESACRSYLVLLPVGFSLPPPLPAARCALTAPFHPCRPCNPTNGPAWARRYVFCGTFPGVAPAGRYPAPCLRGARTFLPPPEPRGPGEERPSDRLAWDHVGSRGGSVKGGASRPPRAAPAR
jgi:hypothetical protein